MFEFRPYKTLNLFKVFKSIFPKERIDVRGHYFQYKPRYEEERWALHRSYLANTAQLEQEYLQPRILTYMPWPRNVSLYEKSFPKASLLYSTLWIESCKVKYKQFVLVLEKPQKHT